MRTKTMKKTIAMLLAAVLFFTTLVTIPLSVRAEGETVSNASVNMDDIDRAKFQKTVLTSEGIAKLNNNSNDASTNMILEEMILSSIGAVAGDMRCWAVGSIMDSLFGKEAPDYLTASAAAQMQNDIINAIGSVKNLTDLESLVNELNAFIDAASKGREVVDTTMASLKYYEDESNPKAEASPETIESRLRLMSNKELVDNANIDGIYNALHTAVMTKHNVTFGGVLASMDLIDVYRSAMRYTFPWESDGMESMKAYYKAVFREYALISFIEVLSLDARYQLAETEEMKVWYREELNTVVNQIEDVSQRLNHVLNNYINDHDYYYFWAPGYSVKFAKRDSYAIDPITSDSESKGWTQQDGKNVYDVNPDFWAAMYKNKGMNEVLDGNGYQAMLDACAQYADYQGKSYNKAKLEDLLTWGGLGIAFNQKTDKFLCKITNDANDFPVKFNYTALPPWWLPSGTMRFRSVDADTKAGTVLNDDNTFFAMAVYRVGQYDGDHIPDFRDRNFYCLPVLEHPHMVDGNVMEFQPWTKDNSLPRTAGNYYLTKDVTLPDTGGIPKDCGTINLCLNGHVIKPATEGKQCFNIGSRTTLNLHDCNEGYCTHTGYVDDDGLWHLGEGKKTIAGGVLTGGTESGVYVWAGGHFNMYGGTIAGNKANHYGGGVDNRGVFEMYGGDICYNTSGSKGGGLYTISPQTRMYGGSIRHNTSGSGGGVVTNDSNAVFEMYNGEINNNKATYGGGVCVDHGKFNMHNGTIRNNTATYGSGVFDYSQMYIGGSSVIDNNAKDNLYVKAGYPIYIGTGDNGVPVPTKDMQVGVTNAYGTGAFTQSCSDYSENFFADNAAYKVAYNGSGKYLELVVKSKEALMNYFKGEMTAYLKNPAAYPPEKCRDLLMAYENTVARTPDYLISAESQGILTGLNEMKAAAKKDGQNIVLEDHQVSLSGINGEEPDWKFMLQAAKIDVPEAIQKLIKAGQIVLAFDDISVTRYDDPEAEVKGPFILGFGGEQISQYKDADVVLYHQTKISVETLKPKWNAEKQCFEVTTESCSPFVLVADAASVTAANTGVTPNNTDLPVMLGFIAMAVAGLVVVMVRRRKDQ